MPPGFALEKGLEEEPVFAIKKDSVCRGNAVLQPLNKPKVFHAG